MEACRRVFASDTRWTVVRGSDLEEGESQGLPVGAGTWAPILESNITRRVDFALFMEALQNDELVHEAPAIVGCRTPRRSRTLQGTSARPAWRRAGAPGGPYTEVPRGVPAGWLAGAVHAPSEWRRAA